ncbi:unnamed protein product [Cyclocybe aegerita]|uniref:Pescadillo homolog n=1 Tax=Cyclocybe aegerita TaxID=1973307 RepID=A0A8S0VY49_CYCAE|nr:unnamed protein product [Cyclocybe aegerita]
MGRLKVKGKAGAAKNYTTRSAAVKKLQCSLADFRRLCILKGIFPREPRNKKKANKGSSAPTSFYYTKDIAYLAHEPILKKLREHKAFAKKISRALGRGEWDSAKSLEENKPHYRLDHIIKERYPTFIDAVRDIDDALCMVFLFSSLPSTSRLPPELVENFFLSIKGVYYQAEVMDQPVTWLVPYQFTQNVPSDVDIRVMLTFLELYQTLLSFVFFKLYSDTGLVYPPPLDAIKDEGGAGINAFSLQDSSRTAPAQQVKTVSVDGRQVSVKDIRQTIKAISVNSGADTPDVEMPETQEDQPEAEEEFVVHQSSTNTGNNASLPTLQTLSALPQTLTTNLFAPYTFFLSRETSRPIFEFVIRSFGGRIGWPASSGAGSPFDESDPRVTHVIIDRPVVAKEETPAQRELRLLRKFVQPQWVIDCINAGKVLIEEPYLQGKTLPPHISPFGEYEGAYNPINAIDAKDTADVLEQATDSEEDEAMEGDDAVAVAVANVDPAALRAAELAAEAAGVDYGTFEAKVKDATKKQGKKASATEDDAEGDMNKMMMSNKQKKLYEKMKYSQRKKEAERTTLEDRKKELVKQRRKKTTS